MIQPGGPYFKMPWEKIHKVSIATMTINMALDLEDPTANDSGTRLEAVTKDQLNTGLTGQIRYRVSEANLYAFLFGIKKPFVHVMAYFVSVLRQRIANFEAKPAALPRRRGRRAPDAAAPLAGSEMTGISINDLRKNLRDLNEYMDNECRSAPARYGVIFDASLITGIDPPPEVESALAAINTAHNQVSSDISLAQAARRSARRAIAARGGNRDAAGAGRSGAGQIAGRGTGGAAPRRAGRAGRLPAERAAGALRQGRSRSIWRRANDRLAIRPSLAAALIVFVAAFLAEPVLLGLARIFGLYAIVQERTCRVYVLFGKVVGVLDEPGLHFLPAKLGAVGVRRSTSWAPATCWTCGSTRNTCAASRSIPKKARPWASASGTRCGSAIRWRTCSRIPIRAARCAPTSATPRCAA